MTKLTKSDVKGILYKNEKPLVHASECVDKLSAILPNAKPTKDAVNDYALACYTLEYAQHQLGYSDKACLNILKEGLKYKPKKELNNLLLSSKLKLYANSKNISDLLACFNEIAKTCNSHEIQSLSIYNLAIYAEKFGLSNVSKQAANHLKEITQSSCFNVGSFSAAQHRVLLLNVSLYHNDIDLVKKQYSELTKRVSKLKPGQTLSSASLALARAALVLKLDYSTVKSHIDRGLEVTQNLAYQKEMNRFKLLEIEANISYDLSSIKEEKALLAVKKFFLKNHPIYAKEVHGVAAEFYAYHNKYKEAYFYQGEAQREKERLQDLGQKHLHNGLVAKINTTREIMRLHTRVHYHTLNSMRYKLNPHFVFNALNSIQSMVTDNNPRVASRFISTYARLMRQTFKACKNEYISLAKEIRIVKNYIRIEQVRFSHAFTYNLEVDSSIDTETALIPGLVLQPFIENAINHGLRDKENGKLSIYLKGQTHDYFAHIIDNGKGMPSASRKPKGYHSRDALKERFSYYKNNGLMRLAIRFVQPSRKEGTHLCVRFTNPSFSNYLTPAL